jgi:hypothetical protein
MTQDQMKLYLGDATAKMGPKISLKNVFEHNLLAFFKVNVYSKNKEIV